MENNLFPRKRLAPPGSKVAWVMTFLSFLWRLLRKRCRMSPFFSETTECGEHSFDQSFTGSRLEVRM
jgi:hypothetical protein